MSELTRSPGAPMPLFDRLVADGEEAQPRRVYGYAELKESVRRELERLLGTRRPEPAYRLGPQDPTVLDYGIPDFSGQWAQDPSYQQEIARAAQRAIAAFEPRLRQVRVQARPGATVNSLVLEIAGVLAAGEVTAPVAFAVPIEGGAAAPTAPHGT